MRQPTLIWWRYANSCPALHPFKSESRLDYCEWVIQEVSMVYALILTFALGFVTGRIAGWFSNRRAVQDEEPETVSQVPTIIISASCGFLLGLLF